MLTYDPDLIAYYAAAEKNFYGLTILEHEVEIRRLCEKHRATSMLDYGSGKGHAWARGLGQRLGMKRYALYDPAVPEFEAKPAGTFDAVVCCDVLEHIGEEHLDLVIAELFDYADEFVWMSTCCREAKKHLPDGRNLHVTVQPMSWWRRKIDQIAAGRTYYLVETP